MKYKKFANFIDKVSVLGIGTWAFSKDVWWGPQKDRDSLDVLKKAFDLGINFIDTAPIYGRGHSEEVVGRFLKKTDIREKIFIATKLGLAWTEKGNYSNNLKRERMLEEIEDSRQRLGVDYIDLYQIHWPDPNTSIKETAETMNEFFSRGLIKAVGVSNYSVKQMKKFMKYCPLHSLQPPYNMFDRRIENEILPFCIKNNIAIVGYSPLHGGVLTGKFFFENVKIPEDKRRKNIKDLKESFFSINKKILSEIKEIALKYNKTLSQFVLNWTFNQKGIKSILIGARNIKQLEENFGAVGWKITNKDLKKVNEILVKREKFITSQTL